MPCAQGLAPHEEQKHVFRMEELGRGQMCRLSVKGRSFLVSQMIASNDELYSKMRDQRIQREELRSKKKELEAIMKKDQNRRQYFRNQDNQSDTVSYTTGTDAFGASASADATMATWGGSTVDNLENITEDEDGQDGTAHAEEDDDGYPSDGIVQVEEEEEENETDNATYTIDADARQRRQACLIPSPQGQGARPKTARGRRGFPQPVKPELDEGPCHTISQSPASVCITADCILSRRPLAYQQWSSRQAATLQARPKCRHQWKRVQ
nr:hypothetical protein BaRGS_026093 [Batillaria attramentaria]